MTCSCTDPVVHAAIEMAVIYVAQFPVERLSVGHAAATLIKSNHINKDKLTTLISYSLSAWSLLANVIYVVQIGMSVTCVYAAIEVLRPKRNES